MNQKIVLGNIVIGDSHPVVTIAEAACEHLGSLEMAKRMVEAAKEAGADIIKFQLHLPEEMIPGSIRFWGGSMDEVLAKYNLSLESQAELLKHCEDVGIHYLCTPFSAAAADLLQQIRVSAFKTGSGEMTNIPMLSHIARKGKPMIVSTGMATLDEIDETVSVLKAEGAQFMLMHCTSAYPPRYEQINLRVIPFLKERYGVLVGHSDHTPDIWTALGAAVLGANVIEKHFTLDRRLKGPDHHVSLEPEQFRTMVDAIRKLEASLGSEKKVHPEEEVVRSWAHHSVVSLSDIEAGTVMRAQILGVKRPGSGIPTRYLPQLYGRVAKRNIPANTLLKWDDLEDVR
jgi:sialic acid synthase SpsE